MDNFTVDYHISEEVRMFRSQAPAPAFAEMKRVRMFRSSSPAPAFAENAIIHGMEGNPPEGAWSYPAGSKRADRGY